MIPKGGSEKNHCHRNNDSAKEASTSTRVCKTFNTAAILFIFIKMYFSIFTKLVYLFLPNVIFYELRNLHNKHKLRNYDPLDLHILVTLQVVSETQSKIFLYIL